MAHRPRIAIVGAGPAGLALGVLLQKQNVVFTIFELRPKPTLDDLAVPSGMLDLHEESGLAAIAACGLTDEFNTQMAAFSQGMTIMDKDGVTTYHDDGDLGEYRPEIARHALIGLLLSKVDPGRIRWQHKLVEATRTDAGAVVLDFGGDGTHEFDFVVGADASSPEYTGLQYVTATIAGIAKRFPHMASALGTGMVFVLGSNKAVLGHRGMGDTECLYLTVPAKDEKGGLVGHSPAQIRNAMLSSPAAFGEWGPLAKELIQAALDDTPDASLVVKPMYRLPADYAWESSPSATLVGDAAHLMLPYAGEGVNLALWDVLDLSTVITAAVAAAASAGGSGFRDALVQPLAAFEENMTARARERAEETERNGSIIFSDDGALKMAELMKSFGP